MRLELELLLYFASLTVVVSPILKATSSVSWMSWTLGKQVSLRGLEVDWAYFSQISGVISRRE